MKHSLKRLLSLLLALIFCVGLFPATALAEEPEGEIAPVEDPAPAPDQGDDSAPGGIIGPRPTRLSNPTTRRMIPRPCRQRTGPTSRRKWSPPAPAAMI